MAVGFFQVMGVSKTGLWQSSKNVLKLLNCTFTMEKQIATFMDKDFNKAVSKKPWYSL